MTQIIGLKIELGKHYRTRDGREVRIYAVDGGGEWPVHGAYRARVGPEWISSTWPPNGRLSMDCESNTDLIEVKPRIRAEVWVNVFRGDNGAIFSGALFPTREAARTYGSIAVACIPLTIDCEEGEGL